MMKSARMHEYEVKIQCEKIAGNKLITSSYFKRIEYFLGNGRELLSSILVMAMCHDSRVFRTFINHTCVSKSQLFFSHDGAQV